MVVLAAIGVVFGFLYLLWVQAWPSWRRPDYPGRRIKIPSIFRWEKNEDFP